MTADKPKLQIRVSSKKSEELKLESPSTQESPSSKIISDTNENVAVSPSAAAAATTTADSTTNEFVPLEFDSNATFSAVNQIHTHHQSTSIHFTYNSFTQRWCMKAKTTMYLSHTPKMNSLTSVHPDTMQHSRELALHLRGGHAMKVTSAMVYLPPSPLSATDVMESTSLPSFKTDSLIPVPTTIVSHFDPLQKILTQPTSSIISHGPPPHPPKTDSVRYEADSQYTRNSDGMMDALRCASIASNFGELRIRFDLPSMSKEPPSMDVLQQLWKDDLSSYNDEKNDDDHNRNYDDSTTSSRNHISTSTKEDEGILEQQIKRMCYERDYDRRIQRINLISKKLASPYLVDKVTGHEDPNLRKGLNSTMGLKLVLYYEMMDIQDNVHLGGIHFHTSDGKTKTPHIYTTTGTLGDHQGARCWIPIIDSASSKHRSTHELIIKVTADAALGLWAAGCGEHFGVQRTVLHDVPRYIKEKDEDDQNMEVDSVPLVSSAMQDRMELILGKSSCQFISFSFHPKVVKPVDDASAIHVIPAESNVDIVSQTSLTNLATSVWSTSIWNPAPARSLGFAIGPFGVFYDPEYFYGKTDDSDEDNDNEDESEAEEEDDDDDYPTISDAAEKKGEGIRQLYFVMRNERPFIHANASHVGMEESAFAKQSKSYVSNYSDDRRKLHMSIMGTTAGVPNRALALMRDILSLPTYRTSSYTQIWIPYCVDGGVSCGTLHACPDISCNSFLGGSIIDSNMLPAPGTRLPFYFGGRTVQMLQARCVVRSWITAAVPLGGQDDVGHSYILGLFEQFLMSLYERSHGAYGEGGSKFSFYHSKRFSLQSGLNSKNLPFLPVANMEEDDDFHDVGMLGSLLVEDKGKEILWRNVNNGTESHTSSKDEFLIRQLLAKDFLEGIERQEKSLPSMGWLGSLLSATFLSSNSASSSRVGCGAVELMHPIGGRVYRDLKLRSFQKIIEGRCGPANFVRIIRAAFIAAILEDSGVNEVEMTREKKRKTADHNNKDHVATDEKRKPIFVLCIDELIKKGGITHGSFIRSLKVLSGIAREPYVRGTLVDVSKEAHGKIPSIPEGFPNSFLRGSSGLYLRVGTHIEPVTASESSTTKSNLLQVQIVAEPVIPTGGIAFGGPVTVRIIEKGGSVREFVKYIESDGSRSDWGPIFLQGEPVTTAKAQAAASGTAEAISRAPRSEAKIEESKSPENTLESKKDSLFGSVHISASSAYNENQLHKGGFQALELARLTNCTPLLWVRVDPHGLFDGRIALFQPDACLGEQLFHDGDAFGQLEAIRALTERPLRVQVTGNVKTIHGVEVSELSVRLLSDCLRGSIALYADLPHNPAIRSQAAVAIAQWQNNKAPDTKDSTGWIGLELLIQYYSERFFKDGKIRPCSFSRICLKSENSSKEALTSGGNQPEEKIIYTYLDRFDSEEDRKIAIESANSLEKEENEEYRVRSAVVTSIACIRAKDGQTPPLVLKVLRKILEGENDSSSAIISSLEEEQMVREKKRRKSSHRTEVPSLRLEAKWFDELQEIPYSSSNLISSALLSLCYINTSPALIDDSTGKQVQSKSPHPCVPLLNLCYRWLEWDLYREGVQMETESKSLVFTGKSSQIAPCAITGLCMLALLRQSTTDSSVDPHKEDSSNPSDSLSSIIEEASNTKYYMNIFDSRRSDATRAAAAQAILCLCCAADRFQDNAQPVGLLTGLEFVLDKILDLSCSPGLRHTLAMLMLDACTGKICSTQRVANISSCNDFIVAGSRQYDGPLGATYGSENGSSILTSVGEYNTPAADAVNDGARLGFRLLRTAGQKVDGNEAVIVRVAKFATAMWRAVNGELGGIQVFEGNTEESFSHVVDGICAHDGQLRCILLSVLQWIWPKGCFAVMRVQTWREVEESTRFTNLGMDEVMNINLNEKAFADFQDKLCSDLRSIIAEEKERQIWRGELAEARRKEVVVKKDSSLNSQSVNYPLEIVQKDEAWKLGSWVSSTAQQRRAKGADGGSSVSVTKLRLKLGNE